MSEAAAMRYLISKGWSMIGEGWFVLRGACESPVCIETAFHMQKRMDMSAAA